MTPTTKHIPDRATTSVERIYKKIRHYLPPRGFFILMSLLVGLATFASYNVQISTPFLVVGEIAPHDIVADRSLLFEDATATKAKRDLVSHMEPLTCMLSEQTVNASVKEIESFLTAAAAADSSEAVDQIQSRLNKRTNTEYSAEDIRLLATHTVQENIKQRVLPVLQRQLAQGVLPDIRVALSYAGGIRIVDEAGQKETIQDLHNVTDLHRLEEKLSREIALLPLSSVEKGLVRRLISQLLSPTLIPSMELTNERKLTITRDIPPVMLRVQQGEILAHEGDTIDAEQQLKIQALWKKTHSRLDKSTFLGLSICTLLLSAGLFVSPSGKPGTPMQEKDYLFIAALVIIWALMAKGFSILGVHLAVSLHRFSPDSLAFAVPVAGAAALAGLIFTTRRYLVIGLLLAFYCTMMSKGGLSLFLYYFLSCMFTTWLTTRIQSRQDFVLNTIPLGLCLLALWLGTTFLQGGGPTRYLLEACLVIGNTVVSMLLTFALAPVVETIFGYTTSFRLMELLNLEQPLLRNLMFQAPGTYHHSLIVSNMAAEGAKAVGANALLCKVAGLYHDIGKISKANYFIENQFSEQNPHDKLAPSMSALILISHAKNGAELAKKHRLGNEVTNIIQQHHGTGIIQYFYQKALHQHDAAPPHVEDFQYPGPKPQSREAAIVMFADIVEASSRTLDDPSPAKLQAHIENVAKGIYSTGQFDHTELTFKDIDKLIESFYRVLRGLFHHRIIYPESSNGASGSKAHKDMHPSYKGNGAHAASQTNKVSAPSIQRQTESTSGNKPSVSKDTLRWKTSES